MATPRQDYQLAPPNFHDLLKPQDISCSSYTCGDAQAFEMPPTCAAPFLRCYCKRALMLFSTFRPPSFFFFFSFFGHSAESHSQARDQIQTKVVTYATAAAALDALTHCARLGIQPASWHCRDATDPTEPKQELQTSIL